MRAEPAVRIVACSRRPCFGAALIGQLTTQSGDSPCHPTTQLPGMWWGRVRDKENAELSAEAHNIVCSSPGGGALSNAQWTATVVGYAPPPPRASRKDYQLRSGTGDSPLRSYGRPPLQRTASSNIASQPASPSCDRRSPPAHSAHEQFSDNKPQRKSEQLPPLGRQAAQRQDASAPNLGPLGIGRYALAQRPQPAAPAAAPPRPQRQHTGAAQDGAPARGGVKRAPGSGAGPRSQPAGAHTPVKRFKVHFMESHGIPKRIAAVLMQHCATVGIHFPSSSRCILVVNLLADCQNWMPRTVPAAGILEHTAIEGAASSVEVSVRCRWAASPVTCAPATPMTFTPGSSSGQFSRFGRRAFALQMAPGSPPRVSSRSPAFTTSSRGTLMISPRGSGMQSPAVLCRTPAVRLPPVSRSQAAGTVMLRRQMLSLSSLPCWHAWRPLCCCRGAELIVIPALLPAAAHSCRQQCSNASRRDKPAAAC